jgi:hypothetical protein
LNGQARFKSEKHSSTVFVVTFMPSERPDAHAAPRQAPVHVRSGPGRRCARSSLPPTRASYRPGTRAVPARAGAASKVALARIRRAMPRAGSAGRSRHFRLPMHVHWCFADAVPSIYTEAQH